MRTLRRSFPQVVSSPGWPDLRADAKVRVRRVMRGGHDAVVSVGARKAQVRSTLPLSFSDARGQPRRALSTRLVDRAGKLAPAHALSRYRIATRLRQGDPIVAFDRAKFAISATQVRSSRVREVSGKAMFANTETDSDVLVTPLPTGASVMWQLRSPDSPASLRLDVDGVDDVRVKDARPADLVRSGRSVGSISAPKAFDADGRPVRVSWVPDGGGVRIDVAHRERAVRYPVLVDPFVNDDQRWWIANGALDFSGWEFLNSPGSAVGAAAISGLWLATAAGSWHQPNTSGVWSFRARSVPGPFAGEGAHIFKVDFGYTAAAVQGSYNACWAQGILDYANLRWEPQGRWRGAGPTGPFAAYPVINGIRFPFVSCANEGGYGYRVHCLDNCGDDGGDWTQGSPGNAAVIGLLPGAGQTSGAVLYMGSSLIFQSESYPPKIAPRSPPTGWIDATTLTVDATDYGLGTTALNASAPGWAGAAIPRPPCLSGDPGNYNTPGRPKQGDRNNRCRQSETLQFPSSAMPEGSYSVNLTARDIVDNQSSSSMPVKIDHSKPSIQITGPASGAPIIVKDADVIRVAATDQHSGVRTLSYSIDGGASIPPRTCATDGCSLSLDYAIDTDVLDAGSHTIVATATDGAGHTTTSPSTSFVVDASPPEIGVGGGVVDLDAERGRVLTENSYRLLVDADDNVALDPAIGDNGDVAPTGDIPGVGVRDVVIRLDGQTVPTSVAACFSHPECEAARAWDWDTTTAANGVHTIEVTATDRVGNQNVESWDVNLQRTGNQPARTNTAVRRTIVGGAPLARAGTSVAAIGDVNGDRLADYVVGAPGISATTAGTTRTAAGAAYIVLGSANPSTVDLATGGPSTRRLLGPGSQAFCGTAVAAAGDMNGDGLSDILVGCPGVDSSGLGSLTSTRGRVYVVFGRTNPQDIDLGNVGSAGFEITGPADPASLGVPLVSARPAVFGERLSNVPLRTDEFPGATQDVNGDGLADIVLGDSATARGTQSAAGTAYVIYGKVDSAPVNVVALGVAGFTIRGDLASGLTGYSATVVNDVDGDTLSDVLIGSPGATSAIGGRAHVVYGAETTSETPNPGDVDLAQPGTRAITLASGAIGDRFGVNVAGLGDTDYGSEDDIAIGTSSGAYVLRTVPSTSKTVSSDDGYRITGPVNNPGLGVHVPGAPVAPAGDIDGDERADLVIGYPDASGDRAYTVISPEGTRTINVASLPGQHGSANAAGSQSGRSGAAVSANSYQGETPVSENAQVIVGAPATNDGLALSAGAAYVLQERTPAGPGPTPDPPGEEPPAAAARASVPSQYTIAVPWSSVRNQHGQFVVGHVSRGAIFNAKQRYINREKGIATWYFGRLYRNFRGCGWVETANLNPFKDDVVGDKCGPVNRKPDNFAALINCDVCVDATSIGLRKGKDSEGKPMPEKIAVYRNARPGRDERGLDKVGEMSTTYSNGNRRKVLWRYISQNKQFVLIRAEKDDADPLTKEALWGFIRRKWLPSRDGDHGLCGGATPIKANGVDPSHPDRKPRPGRRHWPKVCQRVGYYVNDP